MDETNNKSKSGGGSKLKFWRRFRKEKKDIAPEIPPARVQIDIPPYRPPRKKDIAPGKPPKPRLTLPQLVPDVLLCISDFLDWPSVICLKLTCKSMYQRIPMPKYAPTDEQKERVLRVFPPTRYIDNELPYLCRACMMWHSIKCVNLPHDCNRYYQKTGKLSIYANTHRSGGYNPVYTSSSSYSRGYAGEYYSSSYNQTRAQETGGGRAKRCGRCLGLLEPGYNRCSCSHIGGAYD